VNPEVEISSGFQHHSESDLLITGPFHIFEFGVTRAALVVVVSTPAAFTLVSITVSKVTWPLTVNSSVNLKVWFFS